MQVKWVFEKDAYDDGNTELMIDYLKSKNIDYQVVPYVMFGRDDHIEWKFGREECVIAYGTIGFSQFVQHKKCWYPGVWTDWHKLKCSTYLSHLGNFSVQQDYVFLPIAEIYRRWEELWERFQFDGHVFIRPDENDKRFHGEKISGENKEKWYKYARFYDAPPESLAMISRPSRLTAEWRFIIANKKVVTGSLYKADGRTGVSRIDADWDFDHGAIEFAEKVAAIWEPAPIYTLDVCYTENGEYKLMEIGSLNCCGLYKCDVSAIINAANEIAITEWRETHLES